MPKWHIGIYIVYQICYLDVAMSLKEIRKEHNLSQLEASKIIGVSLRTYVRYENDDDYGDHFKRDSFVEILQKKCEITEEKGVLTIDLIKKKLQALFDKEYPGEIDFCYLFGSYATGKATESSDVDLYVATSLTGLRFVGLMEKIRNAVYKKVDVIRSSELKDNIELVNEILKYGVKIYG